jgi:hypothetical protein
MYSFEHCAKNFDYINEGSCRQVYGIDNEWVIKKAYTNGGYWQNQNEIELYKKYKDTILPLCPIDLSKSTESDIFMLRAEAIADMYEKDEKLWDSFDSILMKYLENCVKLYSTEEGKKEFLSELPRRTDKRLRKFMKKLTKFDSNFISSTFYDVCSFNCGLLNGEIVVLDYGFPEEDIEVPLPENFYHVTTEYDNWFNN